MTDRIHALTVTLSDDIRSDDVEHIVNAIRMIRGVGAVDTHVTEFEDHTARQRVRVELSEILFEALDGALHPDRTEFRAQMKEIRAKRQRRV